MDFCGIKFSSSMLTLYANMLLYNYDIIRVS